MPRIPEPLHSAVEALYGEFERYRPTGAIAHSPLKPHSVVEPLENQPLRKLTAHDFAAYSGSAVWTVGSLEDFKYFFPRIAELALLDVVGGSGWDSWAYRLAPGLTTSSERYAVQTFFRTLWHTAATSYWDVIQVPVVELLYALPFIFDDIEPLLAVFHPCASRSATRNLSDICDLGPTWAGPGSERPAQIADWLVDRAPRWLAEATATFPDT